MVDHDIESLALVTSVLRLFQWLFLYAPASFGQQKGHERVLITSHTMHSPHDVSYSKLPNILLSIIAVNIARIVLEPSHIK